MPLRSVINKRIVSVFNYTDDQLRYMQGEARAGKIKPTCVECGGNLQVRCVDTDRTIAHFFHVGKDRGACITGDKDYFYHELVKENLKQYLTKSPLWNVAHVEEESQEHIENGSREWRRIDVKATNGDGTITAHEAQLSYQPISTIQERTHDYTKIGMESFWWLGNNFDRAYLRKLEAVNIKCGRVEISEDYAVTFSFSPNGIVLPTWHGGKARIIAYNRDRDIYQTASQVWWNIKNGVLVEVPIIQ